jgi:hypothetical protein
MATRRGFLYATLGLLTLGVGAFAADIVSEHEIVALVRKRLSFLNLDEGGLKSFAHDYIAAILAKRPTWGRIKFHVLSMFARPVARYGFSSDNRNRKQRLADNLATLYLLSSDFFTSESNEKAVVQYVNLYDPMRACGNPFARPPLTRADAA